MVQGQASVIWLVLLLGGCLIVDVSGQTTIRSSLQSTNRMYVCPEEIVTYVCSGVGIEMRLSAPPHIPSGAPLLYERGDTEGTGNLRAGPIASNLISTDSPLMVADLIVQNSSLPEFSVLCTVPPSPEAVAQHKPSDPPLDVTSAVIRDIGGPSDVNATMEVTWIRTGGNYDPCYYTVQLFVNTDEPVTVVISAESNSSLAVFFVPFVTTTVNVTARITVTSKCGQTTTGVFTDTVTITRSTSLLAMECTTSFVLVGIFAAATLILSIVVIVVIILYYTAPASKTGCDSR